MRNIKFRAWDKVRTEYLSAGQVLIHVLSKERPVTDRRLSLDVDGGRDFSHRFILEQFIGLTDQKGVEIYEGDIVECTMAIDGGSLPHRGEIVFVETFGAFATKNQAGETLMHNHHLNTFQIIGNIHNNPDIADQLRAAMS